MKPIIVITFLITLMLMGSPVLNDSLSHTGSGKGAAETTISAGTQDAEMNEIISGKPGVQSAQMQQNSTGAALTLPGKNSANLIIIL